MDRLDKYRTVRSRRDPRGSEQHAKSATTSTSRMPWARLHVTALEAAPVQLELAPCQLPGTRASTRTSAQRKRSGEKKRTMSMTWRIYRYVQQRRSEAEQTQAGGTECQRAKDRQRKTHISTATGRQMRFDVKHRVLLSISISRSSSCSSWIALSLWSAAENPGTILNLGSQVST